ncbi:MAG: hypothetical protein V7K97_07670 [Nostoc sp.]|uniref:hypothetical protein n=1 Tax=Nostoc sp. TaxID=1180 RepID=UPI002FFBE668
MNESVVTYLNTQVQLKNRAKNQRSSSCATFSESRLRENFFSLVDIGNQPSYQIHHEIQYSATSGMF